MPAPILDPIAVQSRSRPRGALNPRQNPSTNEGNNQLDLEIRGGGRRNERSGGRRAQAGAGSRRTRREPSGFEIGNNEMPSSST